MRKEPPYRAIVADHRRQRAQVFARLLDERYASPTRWVSGWDELCAGLKELPYDDVDLLVVARDLPGLGRAALEQVNGLRGVLMWTGRLIVVAHGAIVEERPDQVHVVHLESDRPVTEGEASSALRRCGLCSLPEVQIRYASKDRILSEIVRSLDLEGDRGTATRRLATLIRNVVPCGKAKVLRLPQGFSGANLLQVMTDRPKPYDCFVLKTVPFPDLWKVRNELKHRAAIEEAFASRTWRRHVPTLLKPATACTECPQLVSSGGHYGVAYEYLGFPAGRFLSLHDAYISDPEELASLLAGTRLEGRHRGLAGLLLAQVLRRLKQVLYQHASTKKARLWDKKDAVVQKAFASPPYRLTASHKARILGSAKNLDPIGTRLLGDCWDADRALINRWIESGPNNPAFKGELPLLVSAVHGDLNGNNVLVWLNESQPFFIDFANYQKKGHLFQDLARLEVEVKFVLMDREASSPVPALDLDPRRLPLWCRLEAHLAAPDWDAPFSPRARASKPAARALRLVQRIRRHGREIREDVFGNYRGADVLGFDVEYRVALLYHTLRAIAYEDLSPFKRLLAVRSAGQLIRQLNGVA